jgi:hypothetical protein
VTKYLVYFLWWGIVGCLNKILFFNKITGKTVTKNILEDQGNGHDLFLLFSETPILSTAVENFVAKLGV